MEYTEDLSLYNPLQREFIKQNAQQYIARSTIVLQHLFRLSDSLKQKHKILYLWIGVAEDDALKDRLREQYDVISKALKLGCEVMSPTKQWESYIADLSATDSSHLYQTILDCSEGIPLFDTSTVVDEQSVILTEDANLVTQARQIELRIRNLICELVKLQVEIKTNPDRACRVDVTRAIEKGNKLPSRFCALKTCYNKCEERIREPRCPPPSIQSFDIVRVLPLLHTLTDRTVTKNMLQDISLPTIDPAFKQRVTRAIIDDAMLIQICADLIREIIVMRHPFVAT